MVPIIFVEILEEVAGAMAALGVGALGKNAGTLLGERAASLAEKIFSYQKTRNHPTLQPTCSHAFTRLAPKWSRSLANSGRRQMSV
jgi:hypothetical protein